MNIKQSCSLKKGLTLIELIVAIAVFGLFFYGLFAALQTSLALIAQGKIKTTANALATERIEKVRSIDYGSLGTYVQNNDSLDSQYCPTYDPDTYNCVEGSPAGPIAQSEQLSLNNIEFTINTLIDHIDDPADGLAGSDGNGVLNDYKIVEVVITWTSKNGPDSIRLTSQVSPEGIETNSANCQEDYGVDCGSLRVNVYDSNGNPVPNLDVLITNDSIAPAISQPGTTDVNGRRLLSTLPQASGYEVFVNINSADLNGNGLADDLDNSDYGYARTYNTGETWTFNDNPATLISPNPDKLTVESGLITSITFIVDLTSDVALTAYEESRKEDVSVELNNYSNYILNRAVDNGGVLELADDPGGGKYFRGFASLSDIATNDTLLNWLWFEFDTINETSTEYVRARFYDNSASPAALIPDSELAGNSSGFTSSDIVDLSGLDTSIYNELYIRFELRGDTVNTPGLVSSSLYALVEGAPINNARLRLYGEKSPGYKSDEPEKQIAKYDMIIATDATGEMTAENLESDTYKARWRPRSGYSPIQTCPKAEGTFTLNPDEDLSIDSLWRDDSSAFDTLTVKVMAADGSTVYPGVTLSLDGDVLPRVGVTDPCGQHTFGDIVEGTHDLELSGPGITATTVSVTINDGWNEYVYSP